LCFGSSGGFPFAEGTNSFRGFLSSSSDRPFLMAEYFLPRTRLVFAWMCFGVHAIALLAVLLVLQRGIPPGDIGTRAAYVAQHAADWQIGWALWLPASLVLVLFHAGMADALNARAWGWLAVSITLSGAVVDWMDEMVWIGLAPGLAARFASDSFAASMYTLWDRAYIVLSIGLANGLYTIGGIILIALAYRSNDFPLWLARWGAVVWSLSIALSIAGLIGDGIMIQIVSALVFIAFMPWLILMGLELGNWRWQFANGKLGIKKAR
jgi:hypothetical protein